MIPLDRKQGRNLKVCFLISFKAGCSLIYFSVLILVLAVVVSCQGKHADSNTPIFADKPVNEEKVYIFSTHPLFSEQRVFKLFAPIMDRINALAENSEFRVRIETAPTYEEYEEQLYAGRYDISLPNPLQTLKSLEYGYRVFGKVKGDQQFRGIILARRPDRIRRFDQLYGLTASFPAQTALAACMMPGYFLFENGVDVRTDIDAVFTGNQESTIMSLASGVSGIAVTWPPPWELYQETHPESAALLEVVFETPPLVNNGLVAKSETPGFVLEKIKSILFSLHEDAYGRAVLASMNYEGFEAADNLTFNPVADFLFKYYRIFPEGEEW